MEKINCNNCGVKMLYKPLPFEQYKCLYYDKKLCYGCIFQCIECFEFRCCLQCKEHYNPNHEIHIKDFENYNNKKK